MARRAREKLVGSVREAAARHGHTCPSLVYGCRLAVMLLEALPEGKEPDSLCLRHTSSCLRDGALSVFGARPALPEPVSLREPGPPAVMASWPGGRIVISVRPEARLKVDTLKGELDLEAFRAAGVEYLLSLTDSQFAETLVE